jgi:hypothetical protein
MFVGANVEHEGQICSAAAAGPSDHYQISLDLKFQQNEDREAWTACMLLSDGNGMLEECK